MVESAGTAYPQSGTAGRVVFAPEHVGGARIVQLQSRPRSDRRWHFQQSARAIQAANACGQDCLIELQARTYTLTIKNTNGQENKSAEGDLDITDRAIQ